MWQIIHWYAMYFMQPNACMHIAAASVLATYSQFCNDKLSRRDIRSSIGLFLVYSGFHIQPSLAHFAYQPFYVVSIVGFRHREFLIFIGGVITGIYLLLTTQSAIVAHILINVGKFLQIRNISFKARALTHIACVFVYANDENILDVEYRDFLLGISAALCAFIHTKADWFSLSMVFSSKVALSTVFMHMMEPHWYDFYRNNHFRRVKNSFYFLYPIAIILLAFGYNIASYIDVAQSI